MKSTAHFLLVVTLFVWATVAIAGDNSGNPTHPAVEGVMGVAPSLSESCAAVWLAIPQGQALAGIEWFNNDASIAFPGLYFESGIPENPVALDQTVLAAENVAGETSGWSSVTFNQPVTCASEGLYVVFRFPEGHEATAYGAGGGPALGYLGGNQGAPGWLCSDGESWDKVGGDYGFAVLPVLVQGTPGMLQLNGIQGQIDIIEAVDPLVTSLQAPFPNPFNPETEIRFSLAKPQIIDLSVYDIRGRLVTNLAGGHHEAGRYNLSWRGEDTNGRRMASGVYFARFKAENLVMNQRLVLVK